MTSRRFLVLGAVLLLMLAFASPAWAVVDSITWANWTYATGGQSAVATGTIGALGVAYSGEIYPFAQVSGGINYWLPTSTFTSSTVTNAPASSDIIRLSGQSETAVKTITFSKPVVDPVMAIRSLGTPSLTVTYTFDAQFDVLQYGACTIYGGPGTLTKLDGNVLEGVEGNGVIQFHGTFTSISWTTAPEEYWHGFTVGIPATACAGIDIKPGSDPNSINLDNEGKGVVPVAILGSSTFDVRQIDPLTVALEGAAVRLKGKSGTAGSYSDVNGDGYEDLVVQIADFYVLPGTALANLTAFTYGGQAVTGSDSIRLVPPAN